MSQSVVYGTRGAVAASQPLAVAAGIDALRAGGTAADAACAAALTLGVVEPMSCGLGGDLFALVWDARQQRLSALNASGHSPASATLASYTERGVATGPGKEIPLTSPLAITVPGAVRGFETLLAHAGRLGWTRAFDAPRRHARAGYAVTEKIAAGWQTLEPKLSRTPEAARAFLVGGPGGHAPRAGELVRLPDLAHTLDTLAEEGADAFYKGAIGEALVAFMNAQGGRWTARSPRGATRSRPRTAASACASTRRTGRGSPRCSRCASSRASTWAPWARARPTRCISRSKP